MPEPVETPEIAQVELPETLALLPVRDLVLFPYAIVPLLVSREVSASAVDLALGTTKDRLLFVTTQRAESDDDPSPASLHEVGTVGTILKMRKLADGRMKILIQGIFRARVVSFEETAPCFTVRVEQIFDQKPGSAGEIHPDPHGPLATAEIAALLRQVREDLEAYARAGKVTSPELLPMIADVEEPGRLSDLLCANLEFKADEGQRLLEELDPLRRLRQIGTFLRREVELLQVQQIIQSRAREVLSRTQREHFLREQIRQIHTELGGEGGEVIELRRRITDAGVSGEALLEAERQLRRMETMQPASPEFAVARTYLEWLAELPFDKATQEAIDLSKARAVLDEDHYDLERIKDRILEYLSVLRLHQSSAQSTSGNGGRALPGSVLCFVGPPGVGKTSLGRSIARALARRFVRVVLGGVRDDAEIRGHRRTYVGAMPGRLIQGMRTAGVKNPVILLDEIDKMGESHAGDPAAALLEVLDPEQNNSFRDHYLGVPYDLSQVLFIATANAADRIPQALRDRLELIHLSGYSQDEKLAIAQRHVVPRAIDAAGLPFARGVTLRFTPAALKVVINDYTREAGLREMERQISAICRKIARQVVEREEQSRKQMQVVLKNTALLPVPPAIHEVITVTPKMVSRYLGPPLFQRMPLDEDNATKKGHGAAIGVALGMAWTPVGGEVLEVESQWLPGKGSLVLTGQLGDVMKESAKAALSFARAYAAEVLGQGERPDLFERREVHLHVPAGAVPKDGPSAGVTIACALASLLLQIPVRRTVAMTGEITLRGRVLPIGGLREKLLSAARAGIRVALIPKGNQRDLQEMQGASLGELRVVLVSTMDDVLREALLDPPQASNRLSEAKRKNNQKKKRKARGTGRLRKA